MNEMNERKTKRTLIYADEDEYGMVNIYDKKNMSAMRARTDSKLNAL